MKNDDMHRLECILTDLSFTDSYELWPQPDGSIAVVRVDFYLPDDDEDEPCNYGESSTGGYLVPNKDGRYEYQGNDEVVIEALAEFYDPD
jgi:hypothetical protein